MIRGVVEKNGSFYRRFKVKIGDKWKDHYVKLPHPTDPRFAEELARINGKPPERAKVGRGTIRALVIEQRTMLAKTDMAKTTRTNWAYYLGLIEEEHGHRLVSELRKAHVYKIRDAMAETPGKANSYISKMRAMLDFACERDWISANPASGVPSLPMGEHDPWPAHVLEAALDAADPMLRLAIVTGLCSGQRLSDVIRMEHGWRNGKIMEVRSKKTETDAAVPMHPIWLAEIAKVPKKSVTLLYDRFGKPFSGTDRVQERLRRLMHSLGFIDDEKQLLYTFHGLGKNACCYLTELGLSDTEISAIVGKTAETVRHYAKKARVLMVAQGASERVFAGRISGLN
ncbi:hypothetical protein [Aquisediminimonas profunda]|uniref:hypothetical protein n=1 Tax=Aquisediminimonas profunda TaxID=1550733 RepID=UPI001FE61809|nr:hypothetical protein [Aquisediminimonas profunda]